MATKHKIFIGDSRSMAELPDKSVHLVVTSPPYWQLKDYGSENQIGFHQDYQSYINNLNLVWQECHRVLHDGCRLCINIGDQFARSVYYGRYKVIPIRTEIIKFCETIGLDYMGAVIWQKVTTCNTTGGASIMGSFPYPRNGILKIDYEFILLFKKHGTSPKVSREIKDKSRMTTIEWNKFFSGHWAFPGEKQKGHLAMYPEELPNRLIRMFTFVGETVMDPFLGSGTTTLASMNLERDSVGYEINQEFIPFIKSRVGYNQLTAFNEAQIEFSTQQINGVDYEKLLSDLPYLFEDPVIFDKKVDPRKLTFGSRIDKGTKSTIELFSIKHILSPELMILNTGQKIRLLGVKADQGKKDRAMQFLRDKLKGQKVFMKYDKIKHDKDNNLYCYLYLRNKTFLNSHLVKNALVVVDDSIEYSYKRKFMSYGGGE